MIKTSKQLKGGMLVAAVIGLDMRATMDIDTTVQSLTLTTDNAKKIIEDIIALDIQDGVEFRITKISDIMEEHDYSGVRFVLEATFDHMRQAIKIDISTGDIITPSAVEFSYKLMLEERFISLWAYNTETLLAEKLETIMVRGTTNTRMRDFYDIQMTIINRISMLKTWGSEGGRFPLAILSIAAATHLSIYNIIASTCLAYSLKTSRFCLTSSVNSK